MVCGPPSDMTRMRSELIVEWPLQSTNLKAKYEDNLFRRNVVSAFENPDGLRFNGIIKEVSSNGELIVELEDETLQKFELKQLRMLY